MGTGPGDGQAREEQNKIDLKVVKVREYWARTSLLIPNVFRHLSDFETASVHLLEFQDLSSKIVLVQGVSSKAHIEDGETKATVSKKQRDRRNLPKHKLVLPVVQVPKKRSKRSALTDN